MPADRRAAEGVQPWVELVYPVEVAIGRLDRAHLLVAYGRGELGGRRERVNRVVRHGLSFPVRVVGASVVACRGLGLGRMSRRRATAAGASYHGGMRASEPLRAAAAVWDIAVPSRPGRMAGVRMA